MTETLAKPDGLLVKFSPTRFADSDLRFIRELFSGRNGQQCPILSRWVIELVSTENLRRIANAMSDPVEVQLPFLNASRWSGADLADALLACLVASAVSDQRPVAAEFFERLLTVIIVLAGQRLRQTDQPKDI